MSESSIVPYVKTTPKPFGVNVEWKWPGGCAVLEMQCLHEDGRLVKERIFWPATVYLISGLKTGERVQVRLRPIAEDGSARDWRASDWIEGVSSVDAEEMVQALQDDIRSNAMFDGQVFINDAFIGNGITSESGRIYASGMGVSVDNGKEQVEFEAEKFEIAASSKGPLDSALQEAIKKIVNEALQKATQPGGLLHSRK